jgi:DNA-binding beta-propeller fold protein YncE
MLAYLVYPAKPGKSRLLKFESFIVLPQGSALNILDYLSVSNHALFVTGLSQGSVFKIALNVDGKRLGNTVSELQGSPEVHGVALVPSKNLAFITRSGKNTVDVVDQRNLQLLESIPVGDDPDAILYDQPTNLIYVANGDARLATLIDPDKKATVASIWLPGRPEFAAVDSKTGLLYQNLVDTDTIVAINLTSSTIVGEWALAPCRKPTGMAIDSEYRRLFTVCAGNAKLVVFDLEKHQVIASLKIGGRPDTVAFDAGLHRIYAACTAGNLTVISQIDADKYKVVDRIRTHFGAHTLAVDPVGHSVYVGYASLFTPPRVAVFSAHISDRIKEPYPLSESALQLESPNR